jgi:hypothetical protein
MAKIKTIDTEISVIKVADTHLSVLPDICIKRWGLRASAQSAVTYSDMPACRQRQGAELFG